MQNRQILAYSISSYTNVSLNKHNFCCGNYSREETIQGRAETVCGNMVDINNLEKYQVQLENIKNQVQINRGLNS